MSPIPVICDRCRIEGEAGADPFAALADLLSFTPVPRRAHANGWTPEHQRGFIAALAVTGSAARAARAIGRHAFGADRLRRAKGGSSFAAAWDAALDLCRERELAGLKDNLADLAAENDEEHARRRSVLLPREERNALPSRSRDRSAQPGWGPGEHCRPGEGLSRSDPDEDWYSEANRQDYLEGMARIRSRLTRARRLLLMMISGDPAKRAAWEVLVGPVDWQRAERLQAQADEPFNTQPQNPEQGMPRLASPDMLITAEAGLLAEFTGGPDALDAIRQAVAAALRAQGDDAAADMVEDQSHGRLDGGTEEHRLSGGKPSSLRDDDFLPADPPWFDEADLAMRRALAAAREAHPEDFD